MRFGERLRQEGHQEGRQEGHQEGRQEGRQEGQIIGQATVLRHLLSKRFGALPEWSEQRIAAADLGDLEQWTDRILDADSVEAVFE